ncbi:MAG: hypothetical protein AAF724_04585 [Pseudomonadota bacterium]
MTPDRQQRNGFDGPLQTVFQDFMADWIFRREKSAQEIMDSYFTEDFSTEIDGHLLDRAAFQSRIDRMRHDADVEGQEFIEMMETENKLFSMHLTRGLSLVTRKPFQTRAIAVFTFAGAKIRSGYLNSVTLGDARDADFASRR